MAQHDIPLVDLLRRALRNGAKAVNMSAADDETQEIIASALSDLRTVSTRVDSLALFSPNETVDDLTARDMVYLFAPFALSELKGRLRTPDPADRVINLKEAQILLRRFTSMLDQYDVVPTEDKALWSTASTDPARRRETKINQYKNEKAVRAMIDSLRASRGQPTVDGGTEFDDILALLPEEGTPPSDDDDDGSRKVILLCLRLMWSKAQAQLGSMEQELEVLRSIPPPPPGPPAPGEQDDATWRLDSRVVPGTRGPLLDSKGKPLRPFTILPAGAASDRQRLQAEVFRPDHRLPTMTIDEYLEEERQRGNIIEGGGQASLDQPTTSEQLAMDAEDDGTFFGEQKAEEKRQKDEKWAQYTDTHRKGEGNTMNRG
ncbi:hypothetical protein EXIGLDRAFT_671305 [Exidia glandulosa HHB12029]|uniref:TAP42-like protein n=1 Tax=Exidia glandulosa HHB12029 TaxID=1314781 RepID=A0A165KD35_EXIGL|nr:hypothetical protein EXIGLDRAFT_671305 [Exidia glandulosa HHB12029]